jgi:hypothetical protein
MTQTESALHIPAPKKRDGATNLDGLSWKNQTLAKGPLEGPHFHSVSTSSTKLFNIALTWRAEKIRGVYA